MISTVGFPTVLYPYELTSLSNSAVGKGENTYVLYPYELTSLSNLRGWVQTSLLVLYPYELTSLSNHSGAPLVLT